MIFRGPSFLPVVWFSSTPVPSPPPPPPPPSGSWTGDAQEDWERDTICRRDREGAGEEPNHTTPKASINHSILSEVDSLLTVTEIFYPVNGNAPQHPPQHLSSAGTHTETSTDNWGGVGWGVYKSIVTLIIIFSHNKYFRVSWKENTESVKLTFGKRMSKQQLGNLIFWH